ncbi:MAG: hypothetical protein ACOH5I_25130 [Oligoflexus sp.]
MLRIRNTVAVIVACLNLVSCVSNLKDNQTVTQFEGSKARIDPVAVQQSNEVLSYEFQNKEHNLEWFSCQPRAAGAEKKLQTFLLINRDEAGFNEQGFCRGWIAQIFLTKGIGVVGVNRPGFGKSTGNSDLGGEHSQHALHALLKHTEKTPYLAC